MLDAGRLTPLIVALGVLAMAPLVVSAAWGGRGFALPLFLLAAEAVTAESSGHLPPSSMVAYAAGLIVLSELLVWSGELPRRGVAETALVAQRLLLLAALALAAALLALVALAAGGAVVLGALAAALIGAPAALALLLLPRLLARRGG
jgi:hypothetical protein